ncbi:histidine phosphatase family protein [Kribbella sp. NPDC051770]|uniref:histidine phosphatase family protein n=1 Tax=Kribbella sp. NPDC051770 TaxID=3155413 RepID=UPI003444A0BF
MRHAMPAHGPETPARDWALTAEGEAAARALCARLPSGLRVVASTEVKAIATVAPLGPAVADARFDEIERVEPYDGDFRTPRRAYVGGADLPEWEAREDVVRRFAAGVAEHAAAGPVAIASHGMAMTVWLTAAVGLGDPLAFWEELRFPDALVVDLAKRSVKRLD